MSMDKYKALLKNINDDIKKEGFKLNGTTFYIIKNDNYGIINFQKSRSSNSKSNIFTINLGVSLFSLRFFFDEDFKKHPSIEDCHWKKRIGFLMTENKDHWWEINDNVLIEDMYLEITEIIKRIAIPEVLEHINSEKLENEWLKGIGSGLSDFQRFAYLTALLKINGRKDINEVIGDFEAFSRGKSFEYSAKEHIKRLR